MVCELDGPMPILKMSNTLKLIRVTCLWQPVAAAAVMIRLGID
jgi:hypothetical protein